MRPAPAAALLFGLAAAALLARHTASVAALAVVLFVVCLRAPVSRRWPYLIGAVGSAVTLFVLTPFVERLPGTVFWIGPTIPVVGTLDVAGMEGVVGGATVSLVAVDEIEPVPPARSVACEALDRLDEAAAVARLDLHRVLERLHRGLSRLDLVDEQHMLTAVAGDPECRAPFGLGRAAAREGGDGEPGGRQASHRPLYVRERITPVFATRTV